MKISIIVPVYNEIRTINQILTKISEVNLPGICEKEIIIVDGHSTDGTREFLCKYCRNRDIKLILEEKRSGKGMAVRKGFKEASGNIIVIQDADLESDPNEYAKLLQPILGNETRVVYGSRFSNGRGFASWGSYLGNQIVTWALNIVFFCRLSDVATVYKVFLRDVVKELRFECTGFDFDVELTAKIIKKNRIKEVPISYIPRNKQDGKKLHWSIGFKALYLILKYRFVK